MQEATALARRRTPAFLMVLFGLYSLMFFAVFSFLPILLTERLGVSSQGAGGLSALAAAGNVVGNLAAGNLLARGVSRPLLIAVAAVVMGASALGIFLPVLGGQGAFILCLLFSATGGLIPATLLATAPAAAGSAPMVPVMMGLLMTGSNFGQVTAPNRGRRGRLGVGLERGLRHSGCRCNPRRSGGLDAGAQGSQARQRGE
ncbi:hypothetical protein [Bradyrhizobium embrapense]